MGDEVDWAGIAVRSWYNVRPAGPATYLYRSTRWVSSMDLVTVCEFGSEIEAELARQLLEANGIRARISGGIPIWGPEAAAFVGGVLQVAEPDRDRAVVLLKNVARHKNDVPRTAWEDILGRIAFWSVVIVVPVTVVLAIVAGIALSLMQ